MLYILASHLGPAGSQVLNAGGIQRVIKTEELGTLVRDPNVQITKANAGDAYHISDMCLALGVEWRWFPDAVVTPDEPNPSPFAFGNGVTRHYTEAKYDLKTVIHKTMLSEDEYLEQFGPTVVNDLIKERVHVRHEGWRQYEERWRPGTCPQYSHQMHLTFLIAKSPFSSAVYERVRKVVEEGIPPEYPELFETPGEPGRYWSEMRALTFKKEPVHAG